MALCLALKADRAVSQTRVRNLFRPGFSSRRAVSATIVYIRERIYRPGTKFTNDLPASSCAGSVLWKGFITNESRYP